MLGSGCLLILVWQRLDLAERPVAAYLDAQGWEMRLIRDNS